MGTPPPITVGLAAALIALAAPRIARAPTQITFTTSDIQQMANLFMVSDSRTLSSLANEQYPDRTGLIWNCFQNSNYPAHVKTVKDGMSHSIGTLEYIEAFRVPPDRRRDQDPRRHLAHESAGAVEPGSHRAHHPRLAGRAGAGGAPGGTLPAGSTLNVAPLTAGQSVTNVPLEVELVALDLKNITVAQ